MKGLNVRRESIKILEENTGSNISDLGQSNFLVAKVNKAKMNYWDFAKIKTYWAVNNETKRQPTQWEKIFTNDI